MPAMGHKTALYDEHVALKARIVDFGGWDMPVQYSSVLKSITPCAVPPACSTSRT
jgi:glycine cleavage system aminomethyltransferase T